jgi:hypothetical protein
MDNLIDQIHAVVDTYKEEAQKLNVQIERLKKVNEDMKFKASLKSASQSTVYAVKMHEFVDKIQAIINDDPDCCPLAVFEIQKLIDYEMPVAEEEVMPVAEEEVMRMREVFVEIQRIVDDDYVFDNGLALDAIEKKVQEVLQPRPQKA